MTRKNLSQINAWLPVTVWAAIIFKLSSGAVPSISTVYIQDYIFKKSAHMFFFGFLGVLFYRALRINGIIGKKAAVYAFLFVILYGISDEVHQSFTQVREARARDVGYDGLGGALTLGFIYYVLPKLPKEVYYLFKELNLN